MDLDLTTFELKLERIGKYFEMFSKMVPCPNVRRFAIINLKPCVFISVVYEFTAYNLTFICKKMSIQKIKVEK